MAEKNEDILAEIRKRFRDAYDAESGNYDDALDDLRFIQGGRQWPKAIREEREADGRPCLEIDKVSNHLDQLNGDIRMNEPSIKIKPVDSKADPETAEIIGGLIRNIETQSEGEIAYDTAAESANACGVGAWRIDTEYADDDAFEQDIRVNRIKNPLSIFWDPAAQRWDKSDARFCFVTTTMPKDQFEEEYPGKASTPAEGGRDMAQYWGMDKTVRVVEYWKKVATSRMIYLVQPTARGTGQKGEIHITDVKPDQEKLANDPNFTWEVLKERKVETHKVLWYKASAGDILDGPSERPGKLIPIVMVYGKELNVEGNSFYRGIVRKAKDPQRLYNYARSTGAEMVSLAPKAPYLVTANMIQNYQSIWKNAHKKSYPYLPYEADLQAPTLMPRRAEPISLNTGIQAEVAAADQEIRDTTGLQKANLGQQGNEKSGRAILARQREGDIGNFAFADNLARALRYSGRVMLDLIPHIYDTARIIRIMGRDSTEEFVPINQPFEKPGDDGQAIKKIFDMTVGKYDVVVSIGPSYTTEREEASSSMMEFLKAVPAAGPLLGDLIAKNQDWPGADEIEKRLKLLLPPALQQQGGASGAVPAAPAPPPAPNPAEMIAMRGQAAKVQGQELDNERRFHELARIKAEGGGGAPSG
jgi:hypothetical protein